MPAAVSESTKAQAKHAAPAGIRFPSLKEKLDPRHCALLIVDVQNEFCDPAGFYAGVPEFAASKLASINRMRGPLLALLEAARSADCLRVFVRAIYDPVYLAPPFAEIKRQPTTWKNGTVCISRNSRAALPRSRIPGR